MLLERCKKCKYQNDTEYDACHICNNEKDMFRPRPSNADRVRAMSDEELAEWIAKHMYCAECMYFNDDTGTCNYEYRYGKGCNGAMLEWLKQEAQDAID